MTPLNALTQSIDTHVTDALLSQSILPPMNGVAGVAERLVILVHYGVDFSIWGESRRTRYWGAFTERIKAATYSGPTLSSWWQDISLSIVSTPRNYDERVELLSLLNVDEQREVLHVLRNNAEALVLRVRVLSEARKEAFKNEGRSMESQDPTKIADIPKKKSGKK